MNYESYHDILKEEYQQRKSANPSYSLRAFARDIGLSGPRLIQILNKKFGLSPQAAEKISTRLLLDEKRKEWFLTSVGASHDRKFSERKRYQEKIEKLKTTSSENHNLNLEYFKVISDWYYFAILEITYLSDFQSSHKWISKQLGIDEIIVSEAIDRLIKLELLELENGVYVDKFKFLNTPSDIPSIALKKFHTQIMQKAMEALQKQSVDQREISSNVFSVNSEKIPNIKKEIKSFRRKLEKKYSQSENSDRVYCLGIQFYNLTTGVDL